MGERSVEAAPLRFDVLDGDENRAAPLASEREALNNSQQREQNGGTYADRGIRRKQTDQTGRDTHNRDRQNQRFSPADPVAQVAEDDRSDGANDERDSEDGEGSDGRCGLVEFGEEQGTAEQGTEIGEHIEVERLERGTDK